MTKNILNGMTIEEFLKGKSVSDIAQLGYEDISGLSRSELAKVVSKMASASNKRLRSLEKNFGDKEPRTDEVNWENHEWVTQAYHTAMMSGGKFSTKDKDLNDLRREWKRAKNFLNSKTSTVKGQREHIENSIKGFEAQGVTNINPENMTEIIRTYDKLKEIDPSANIVKYKVLDEMAVMMDDKEMDADELLEHMKTRVHEIYVEQQQADPFYKWNMTLELPSDEEMAELMKLYGIG